MEENNTKPTWEQLRDLGVAGWQYNIRYMAYLKAQDTTPTTPLPAQMPPARSVVPAPHFARGKKRHA